VLSELCELSPFGSVLILLAGRPKMRWLDDESMDLRKMGINEWRDRARDREAWRHIVKEAKPTPGCSAEEEGGEGGGEEGEGEDEG
jgi:hypothetical protein